MDYSTVFFSVEEETAAHSWRIRGSIPCTTSTLTPGSVYAARASDSREGVLDPCLLSDSGSNAPAGITGINAKKIQWCIMARCEYCGECVLPFTCQHCGGAFCPECRLPPTHQCTGLASWKNKPAPGIGIAYGRGGTATAIPGGYGTDLQRRKTEWTRDGIPWLTVMIAIVIIIMLVILVFVLSG
jgi:hypothetical protein